MRSHKTLARLCVAVALSSAAHVRAQEVALAADDTDGADEKVEHPRGYYCGVKPGGDQAPAIGAKAGTTPPEITWPGFQMMPGGGSRVFVQITTQVDVSAALVGGNVVVDFGDVKIAGRNNRLPLITKFFDTPVTEVAVKREKKRTTLILSMRAPVEPRVSHEQAQSGFHFVYIDFPPGNYQPNDAKVAAATNAPVDLPEAAKPEQAAAVRAAPTHLEGNAAASGQVSASTRASGSAAADASLNAELPPGMGKTKATGKAKAGGQLKFGK